MTGMLSKIFESSPDLQPSDDLDRAENPGDAAADRAEARAEDAGDRAEDPIEAEGHGGAQVHVEADLDVALHNESSMQWTDAGGSEHEWTRSTDVETGFSGEATLSTDLSATDAAF